MGEIKDGASARDIINRITEMCWDIVEDFSIIEIKADYPDIARNINTIINSDIEDKKGAVMDLLCASPVIVAPLLKNAICEARESIKDRMELLIEIINMKGVWSTEITDLIKFC